MTHHGAKSSHRLLSCYLGLVPCLLTSVLAAAPPPEGAEGWLGRELFGTGFTDAGLKLGGWTQVGYAYNNVDHGSKGLGNSPVVLARDTGFQLNQAYLFFERSIQTNIIPRVTPTPAPKPENYSFGWNVSLLYGRDGQALQTYGWDSRWSVNSPGNYDANRATENKQNFLIAPQVFLQGYLPWYKGMAFCLGTWMSPFSYDIGLNMEQGPNFLYSHSYALEAAPVKEAGLIWAANLVNTKEFGILAAEAAIVNGWSNLKDNNNSPAFNFNLRYRTGDMHTWIDFVSMWGNNQ
ncbi:MAG: outer membrane beta-barrel protein, partial [Verrucomicrobiota bacterium]